MTIRQLGPVLLSATIGVVASMAVVQQERDPTYRLEYPVEAEFDGTYTPLIADAWKRHKAMPANRNARPDDFKVLVSRDKGIRRVHFGPKPSPKGVTLGGGNERGVESVYVYDNAGKLKVALGGG